MPLAQRNSSKSSGYISMMSSEPTGTELMPGSFVFDNLRCRFFSSSPYPCTPSSEPVAITSKRPSSLKNFSEVRASGHSHITEGRFFCYTDSGLTHLSRSRQLRKQVNFALLLFSYYLYCLFPNLMINFFFCNLQAYRVIYVFKINAF